jgi:hypothetical protein
VTAGRAGVPSRANLSQDPSGALRWLTSAERLAAARRLERQVPRLTDGQVIVGIARMVAMLGDDETQVILPPSPVYPFAARWIGDGVYLLGVPAADRWLLGARLVAVDGHPMPQVVARLRAEIDYQDPGLARAWLVGWGYVIPSRPGYLYDADPAALARRHPLGYGGRVHRADRAGQRADDPAGRGPQPAAVQARPVPAVPAPCVRALLAADSRPAASRLPEVQPVSARSRVRAAGRAGAGRAPGPPRRTG